MSKTGIAVAAVIAVIALIVAVACNATHCSAELGVAVERTVAFMIIPLMVVALAAAFTALRGGESTTPAILVFAIALLGAATLLGVGAWGSPLALAVCVAIAIWPRRSGAANAA